MNYKLFGTTTGLYVSELVMGASMFGTSRGYGAETDEVTKILQAYSDAGGNFIDTSDIYQLGESEKLVGEFIKHNRHDFVIASKYTRSSRSTPGLSAIGNHRKAMIHSVDESLKRLQTDHIDIYMAHLDDGVTPIDELVRGFDDLVRAGKIVYGGLANFPAWKAAVASTSARLRDFAPVAGLQLEYNLLQRAAERELLPMAGALGMGVMLYSPLAGGLLTGKYRQGETGRMTVMGNLSGTSDDRINATLDALHTIANEVEATPGQVALAWVGTKGGFPILGARTVSQLTDNLKAVDLQLTTDQVTHLDQVSAISLGYPHELLASQHEVMRKGTR